MPLARHKLVEWASSLPTAFKRRGEEGKYILKSHGAVSAGRHPVPAQAGDLRSRWRNGFADHCETVCTMRSPVRH